MVEEPIMMNAETLQSAAPDLHPEPRLVALDTPESPAAEQYRVLWQRVLRLAARRPIRMLAVTSAGRGEGRTTTAANLAITAARDGRAVLLVEADLRHPALARLLGLAARPGAAEVLEGRAELAQAIGQLGPIAVLAAGEPRDAGAALRGASAAALAERLRAAYQLVVLDAPPALAFADGDRLSGEADAALLVVRAGTTPRPVVRMALDALGDRAAGLVLNDVDRDGIAHGRWIYPGEAEPALGR
jgi:capsular exopolysaccharide synthesis family protein